MKYVNILMIILIIVCGCELSNKKKSVSNESHEFADKLKIAPGIYIYNKYLRFGDTTYIKVFEDTTYIQFKSLTKDINNLKKKRIIVDQAAFEIGFDNFELHEENGVVMGYRYNNEKYYHISNNYDDDFKLFLRETNDTP